MAFYSVLFALAFLNLAVASKTDFVIGLFSITDKNDQSQIDMQSLAELKYFKNIFSTSQTNEFIPYDIQQSKQKLLSILLEFLLDAYYEKKTLTFFSHLSEELTLLTHAVLSQHNIAYIAFTDKEIFPHPRGSATTFLFPYQPMLYFTERLIQSKIRNLFIFDICLGTTPCLTNYNRLTERTDICFKQKSFSIINMNTMKEVRNRIMDLNGITRNPEDVSPAPNHESKPLFTSSNKLSGNPSLKRNQSEPLYLLNNHFPNYDLWIKDLPDRRQHAIFPFPELNYPYAIMDYCINVSIVEDVNNSNCNVKRYVNQAFRIQVGLIEAPQGAGRFFNRYDYQIEKDRTALEVSLKGESLQCGTVLCNAGKFLTYGFYKEEFWNISYGWHCKLCDGNTVKPCEGNTKCIRCERGYKANANKTTCEDTYRVVYIRYHDTKSIMMLLFSFITCVAIATTIVLFNKYRLTPVMKSSNVPLTFLQLSCQFVLLITLPFIFIGRPHIWTCALRPITIGLLLTIATGITLSKVQSLLHVFKSITKMSANEAMRTRSAEAYTMVSLVCTSLVILIFTSIHHFGHVELTTIHSEQSRELYCATDWQVFLQLFYIFVLFIFNAVQGFRSRRLPAHFRETSFITLSSFVSSIVLASLIVIYYSQQSHITRSLILYYIIYLLVTLNFVILYIYKAFIILFKPELNSANVFRADIKRRLNKDVDEQLGQHLTRESNV